MSEFCFENLTDDQMEIYQEFETLCTKGTVEEVSAFLNDTDRTGFLPLTHGMNWAAGYGRNDIILHLRYMGVEAEGVNHHPAQHAALYGHVDTVKLLLDLGASGELEDIMEWGTRAMNKEFGNEVIDLSDGVKYRRIK